MDITTGLTATTSAPFQGSQQKDILDVPMPAFLGNGSNNTLRHQTSKTIKSVLAMLDYHSS